MKNHWQRGKDEINELKYCPYCGLSLKKIESAPIKICPEGCCEITFNVDTIKMFAEKAETK